MSIHTFREGSVIVFFVVIVTVNLIPVAPTSTDLNAIRAEISVTVETLLIQATTNPTGPLQNILLILINVVINVCKYFVNSVDESLAIIRSAKCSYNIVVIFI